MYSVTVRDHVMVAHSLTGEIFGPAQGMHGATYVVDLSFKRHSLDADGIVVDIGAATKALTEILSTVHYKNLDEVPEFAGKNTTTEFLAHWIYEQMCRCIASGALGEGATQIQTIAVQLGETPSAWAGYEGPLTLN